MHRGDFWRDRLFCLVSALIAVGLAIAVLWLDNTQRRLSFTRGTICYAIGLAVLILLASLILSWLRQLAWRQELRTLLAQPSEDLFLQLQSAVTREQQVMQSILQEQCRCYQDKLTHYRTWQEQQNNFQSRWAHQMKTPLAVLDLLLQQWDAGEVSTSELTANLREVRDRMADGLELMLHNTRLGQFELDFAVQQVDLLHIVRETINDHKAAFIRYGVFPKLICEQESAYVESDAKWLRFVLNQVLSNALKYSRHEAGEEKTISFHIASEGMKSCVSCTDAGVGIPPQDIERVWQPFFTGANGRRFPEATGMGLYLTKEVCDRLGHQIAIKSQVNEGTTVTITFIAHDHLHRLQPKGSVGRW